MNFKSLVEANQICSVPWTHMDISLGGNKVTPCCKYRSNMGSPDQIVEIWSGEKMKSLRQNFISGEGVSLYDCNKCNSPSDVRSLMRTKNQIALTLGLADNIDIENPALPNSATISLNNTCNLSCRMCNPMFSSRIANIVKHSPIIDSMLNYETPSNYSIDTLDDIFPNLEFVGFLGGEPFYNKEFIDIIRRMKANSPKLKTVTISTNMTVLNIPILEELKTIPHLTLMISIDGPEHVNNYIRAGSEYKTIISNIRYIAENYPTFNLSISHTTSALNVGYLPEFIECMNELYQDIKFNGINTSLVYDPIPLHPASLPDDIKESYIAKLQNFDQSKHIIVGSRMLIASGLHLLNMPREDRSSDNFYKFVNEYDRVLATDYKVVYPEL